MWRVLRFSNNFLPAQNLSITHALSVRCVFGTIRAAAWRFEHATKNFLGSELKPACRPTQYWSSEMSQLQCAALHADVRKSLMEAKEAVERAKIAKAEATRFEAQSLSACEAAQAAAARAMATATDLANLLEPIGVTPIEPRCVLVEVHQNVGPPHSASKKSKKSKKSTSRQRKNVVVGIMDLPDHVIERVFFHLDSKRIFPCDQALTAFALSCRYFSTIFRQSYVKEVKINGKFKFAKEARAYRDAVSGALSRFTSADAVTVFDFERFDDGDLLEQDNRFFFDESRTINYRLALADRTSMSENIIGPEHQPDGIARIKAFNLLVDGSTPSMPLHQINETSEFNYWELEEARWLHFFPGVTSLTFGDWRLFCNGSRVCGDSRKGVTWLRVDLFWYHMPHLKPSDTKDLFLLELLKFRNLETLVLFFSEVGAEAFSDLPAVLELLPNLTLLALAPRHDPTDDTPVLEHVFRDPSSPNADQLKLRVEVGFARINVGCPGQSLDEMSAAIVGNFWSNWVVTEPTESVILRTRVKAYGRGHVTVALATFCGGA